MVVPERTRQVYKLVVPFFVLKLGIIFFSLACVFLFIMGLDYIHVLGRIAENKSLKGENFKLRQEIQLIKNKVDSMEATIERVRNYAKKLQILTGQGDVTDIPKGPVLDEDIDQTTQTTGRSLQSPQSPRTPAKSFGKRSGALMPFIPTHTEERVTLTDRIEQLQTVSLTTETNLSRLQSFLLTRTAIAAATPSLFPIAGWISSTFGYRRHPYDGSYRFHSGVDIAAEPGTPVRAPADGLVIFAGYREGYGKVVVMDHGYGIRTLFAHNSKLFVGSGVRMKRGEVVSQVGATGHATGPHLHYEVRKNGVPVNPATFFSRGRF